MNTEPYIVKHYKSDKPDLKAGSNISLLIDNETFTFVTFNKDYSQLLELCHVKSNNSMTHGLSNLERITFLIGNYQLSGKKYQNVNIAILNSDFTILPEAFALENLKEILEFSSGQISKNTYTHKFNNLSFNYFVEAELINYLEKTFKNASIKHAGAVSISSLLNLPSLKKCDIFLNLIDSTFELLAKQNNNLLYYNVFNYETKEDVMYFLLFMMEQFNFDQNKVNLIVAGQIEAESDLFKTLKKHIKQISFAVNDISLNNNFKDLNIPNHFYFNLLNQHLCEL
jgi:hypothetical protein